MFKNKIPVKTESHPRYVEAVASPNRRVGDHLINWFLRESPPADHVDIVPGSLKPVEGRNSAWQALVQTTIFLSKLGARQHVSKVYFRVDGKQNIVTNKIIFA